MLAASYWSLLSPAEEMAVSAGYGSLSFMPLAVGLLLGAYFVWLADRYAPVTAFTDLSIVDSPQPQHEANGPATCSDNRRVQPHLSPTGSELTQRRPPRHSDATSPTVTVPATSKASSKVTAYAPATSKASSKANANVSRRLLMMMIAITIHNIPEGLAVGVAFGAVGQSPAATLQKAVNLAVGIGIQNFPEGLAVSLPLKAAGMSLARSVWYERHRSPVTPLIASRAGMDSCRDSWSRWPAC